MIPKLYLLVQQIIFAAGVYRPSFFIKSDDDNDDECSLLSSLHEDTFHSLNVHKFCVLLEVCHYTST